VEDVALPERAREKRQSVNADKASTVLANSSAAAIAVRTWKKRDVEWKSVFIFFSGFVFLFASAVRLAVWRGEVFA
jgi:hypothetical protein